MPMTSSYNKKMFCKFCGSPVENELAVCENCAKIVSAYEAEKVAKSAVVKPVVVRQVNHEVSADDRQGFGFGLAATIISGIFLLILMGNAPYNMGAEGIAIFMFLASGTGLALGLVGLSKATTAFRQKARPVASLVLNIIGVSISGLLLFISFIILSVS